MKNNTRKILLALLVILTLIVSMTTLTVSAADEDASVYLVPGDWATDSPRYAVYTWNDAGEILWIDMTDSDSDGTYEATIPAGHAKIIFCRMDPASVENDWANVWNQTVDINFSAGDTFTITDPWAGEGKGATGTWSSGAEVGGNTDSGDSGNSGGPVEGFDSLTVVGDAGLCGSGWNPADDYNDMTDANGDGVYERTFTGIPAGSYSCKVAANHAWGGQGQEWPGPGEGNNYVIDVLEESNVTVYFDTNTGMISHALSASTGPDTNRPSGPSVDVDENDTYILYLANNANWAAPYAHVWIEATTDVPLANWPGVAMSWDEEKLLYYIEIPSAYNSVVFSDYGANQTGDMLISDDIYDNYAGEWYSLSNYTPPTPPANTTEDITVYLTDASGWGEVWIYYWDADGIGAFEFPGTPMDYDAETGLYSHTIPAGYYGVVFSNGGDWQDGSLLQTEDLIIPNAIKAYINNGNSALGDGNDSNNNDAWYGIVKPESDKPGTDNPGSDTDNPGTNEPAKMTFIQKIAKALLLFLRSIEDFFKGIFKK